MASIIKKCKQFGDTRILLRVCFLAKLVNRVRRALVREVIKNPLFTLTELQKSSAEMGESTIKD